MSRIASTYRFTANKRPSASMLERMRQWLFNIDSLDGSVMARQLNGSIDFQVNAQAVNLLHPFKLWLRKSGANWQYAICEQAPDTTGALAGRVLKPDNDPQDVAKVAWTTITATTSFWVRLSVTAGSITVTIVTTEPTRAPWDDPAILAWPLGTITFTSGIPVITLNPLQTDIDLTCRDIPAYWANYEATTCEQILCHGKTGGPKWYLNAGTGDRILTLLNADTLSVMVPASGTKQQILISHDNSWYFFTGTTAAGDEVIYFDGDDFKALATSTSSTEHLLGCDSSALGWAEGDGACP